MDGKTFAAFASLDIVLNDVFTLNIGGRYSSEEKSARIASIPLNLCTITAGCARMPVIPGKAGYVPSVSSPCETTISVEN